MHLPRIRGHDVRVDRRELVMLESSDLVAFAATTDLSRARMFYEQTLGLPVVEHNDFACVLDANGTMLRITAVPEVSRADYTVLGWRVINIAAAIRDLVAKGVGFLRYEGMGQDEDGVWTTPGGQKVAWFADPDGNILSLTQLPVEHKRTRSCHGDARSALAGRPHVLIIRTLTGQVMRPDVPAETPGPAACGVRAFRFPAVNPWAARRWARCSWNARTRRRMRWQGLLPHYRHAHRRPNHIRIER